MTTTISNGVAPVCLVVLAAYGTRQYFALGFVNGTLCPNSSLTQEVFTAGRIRAGGTSKTVHTAAGMASRVRARVRIRSKN